MGGGRPRVYRRAGVAAIAVRALGRIQIDSAKVGLEGYTLHGLRHTFATWLLSSGVDVGTVSSLLGRSAASTTLNVYGHVIVEKQRDAVRIVDRLLADPAAASR